jgi:hypothetical protein
LSAGPADLGLHGARIWQRVAHKSGRINFEAIIGAELQLWREDLQSDLTRASLFK